MIVRGDAEDIYLIPTDRLADWLNWMDIGDPSCIPGYAKPIEYPEQVTFIEPEIKT